MAHHTSSFQNLRKTHKIANISFSNIELKDLGKALFGISFAFAVLFSGGYIFSLGFIFAFLFSLIVVGIGFVFHELSHKILAQRYGCWAEFRSFDAMLIFGILLSFTGFIFIAPGGVIIRGKTLSEKQNGLVSLVGPLMNLLLSLIFMLLTFFSKGLIGTLFGYGFILNSLLAAFNMLPFGNFDGAKVFNWNKFVWVIMMVSSSFLLVISYSGFM